jgi:hypothetical protein
MVGEPCARISSCQRAPPANSTGDVQGHGKLPGPTNPLRSLPKRRHRRRRKMSRGNRLRCQRRPDCAKARWRRLRPDSVHPKAQHRHHNGKPTNVRRRTRGSKEYLSLVLQRHARPLRWNAVQSTAQRLQRLHRSRARGLPRILVAVALCSWSRTTRSVSSTARPTSSSTIFGRIRCGRVCGTRRRRISLCLWRRHVW